MDFFYCFVNVLSIYDDFSERDIDDPPEDLLNMITKIDTLRINLNNMDVCRTKATRILKSFYNIEKNKLFKERIVTYFDKNSLGGIVSSFL